jgi:putative FmdB family regulatory protein
MPIYEFTCASCGEHAEVLQHVGDRPPPCPKCGRRGMKRAVSRTSFQLKGGGWYADLYASKRPGAAPKGDGPPAKPAEAGPAATADKGGKPGATPPASTPATSPPAPATPRPRVSRPAKRRTAAPRRRR